MWKLEPNVNPFSQQTTTTTDSRQSAPYVSFLLRQATEKKKKKKKRKEKKKKKKKISTKMWRPILTKWVISCQETKEDIGHRTFRKSIDPAFKLYLTNLLTTKNLPFLCKTHGQLSPPHGEKKKKKKKIVLYHTFLDVGVKQVIWWLTSLWAWCPMVSFVIHRTWFYGKMIQIKCHFFPGR